MAAQNDRGEIVDLTVRYATAIDRRQYSVLSSVFTEDTVLDYGEVGRWTGAAAVAEFLEQVHAGAKHTMHRLSNHALDVVGDTAEVRTYVDALILTADGSGVNAEGFYDDTVVRTSAGWRISRRVFTRVRLAAVGG